jgi:predicted ATPase
MALAEHLVGRVAELSSVDNLLARLDEGQSAALELAGEPGIGKTRLLAEVASRADARGHIVLQAARLSSNAICRFGCSSTHSTSTFKGLTLADSTRSMTTYARSWRQFSRRSPCSPADAKSQSSTSVTAATCAVCALLERLAQTQPVVLLLDDVHWADPASVELLGALLR